MDPASLAAWIERAHGCRLRGARGEELRLDLARPVRRVTRLWLEFDRAPSIGLGLDPATGGLRWDDTEPHAFRLADDLETRLVDVAARAAIAPCVDRTLTAVERLRFAHAEVPCGLELEFDGFLGLLVFAWGDAIEAWDRAASAELASQGFEFERFEH